MTSAHAKINSSSGGEGSAALHERELKLSKSKIRIRFASDRTAVRDEDEFLERLKNFCKFKEKMNHAKSLER